jgi:hypothetical protein
MSAPRGTPARPLVLLVDPYALRRKSYDLELRLQGFLVLTAHTRVEAARHLELITPHVLVAHWSTLTPASGSDSPTTWDALPPLSPPLVVYGPASGAVGLPTTIDEIVTAIRKIIDEGTD